MKALNEGIKQTLDIHLDPSHHPASIFLSEKSQHAHTPEQPINWGEIYNPGYKSEPQLFMTKLKTIP